MADRTGAGARLEIGRLRLDDVPECIDIASHSFDQFAGDVDAVRSWFDARIAHNPWQGVLDGIGVGVRVDGKLIAFRAMFAQPWWIEGRPTVIAFAAHTSIEPAYRGLGLGSQLIAESREFAIFSGSTSAGDITQKVYGKQGFVAIGGKGNDFCRFRVSYVGSMQSRFGTVLGRAMGHALNAMSGHSWKGCASTSTFRLESVAYCTDEFDDLWVRAREGYPSCLERSSRYLNWRLFDFPTHPLTLLALRDERNRLRGYGVWHKQEYSKDVSCAVLRDLFVASDDDEALRAFMVHVIQHWGRSGITWASLEVACPRLTKLFESLGYERIPSRGNRYYIYSRSGLRTQTAAGWFRSGLDGDYFDTRPPPPYSRIHPKITAEEIGGR